MEYTELKADLKQINSWTTAIKVVSANINVSMHCIMSLVVSHLAQNLERVQGLICSK